MERIQIDIHTDGCCLGNPGVGGWAAILNHPAKQLVLQGNCPTETTNNRMELTAVIEAIKALKKPCSVTVHTDSSYVCMTREKWQKFDKKANLPNRDLWIELINVGKAGNHVLYFSKVKGHSGEVFNERCDKIAKDQAHKAKLLLQARMDQEAKEMMETTVEDFEAALFGE